MNLLLQNKVEDMSVFQQRIETKKSDTRRVVHATPRRYIAGTRESTVGCMDMWLIRSPMNFGVAVHTVHGFTGELWGVDGDGSDVHR
jgi:hypothetical protein